MPIIWVYQISTTKNYLDMHQSQLSLNRSLVDHDDIINYPTYHQPYFIWNVILPPLDGKLLICVIIKYISEHSTFNYREFQHWIKLCFHLILTSQKCTTISYPQNPRISTAFTHYNVTDTLANVQWISYMYCYSLRTFWNLFTWRIL